MLRSPMRSTIAAGGDLDLAVTCRLLD